MRLVVAALAAAALVGCGGSPSAAEEAREHFEAYRAAEVARSEAESELRRVLGDIAQAAGERDEDGVLAAAGRGRDAVATIDRSLERELEAATFLAGYGPTRAEGRKLGEALRKSREGLRLVARQLDIAVRDPFLAVEQNAGEISRLSAESIRIAVPAGFARRRAARAIALALGVEPPPDVMLDG